MSKDRPLPILMKLAITHLLKSTGFVNEHENLIPLCKFHSMKTDHAVFNKEYYFCGISSQEDAITSKLSEKVNTLSKSRDTHSCVYHGVLYGWKSFEKLKTFTNLTKNYDYWYTFNDITVFIQIQSQVYISNKYILTQH